MSQTKITSWEAQQIANRIAEKAFEHLLSPIDEKVNNHLRESYHKLVSTSFGEFMVKYGLGEKGDSITMSVITNAEGGRHAEVIYGDTGEFLRSNKYGADFKFQSIDETPQYVSLCTERAPLRIKRDALAHELRDQLIGRSAKAAMKAWPEAAEFIAAEFGITSHVEMVKPLETLLAQYLPMLAAPQGA